MLDALDPDAGAGSTGGWRNYVGTVALAANTHNLDLGLQVKGATEDGEKAYLWLDNARVSCNELPPILRAEAEQTGRAGAWVASGDGYGMSGVPDGTDSANAKSADPNAAPRLSFDLGVVSGRYGLLARVDAPTAADNSFYVRVDGGAWRTAPVAPSASWQTRPLLAGLDLTAGRHTVEVAAREKGAQLDWIELSHAGSPAASGRGATFDGDARPASLFSTTPIVPDEDRLSP